MEDMERRGKKKEDRFSYGGKGWGWAKLDYMCLIFIFAGMVSKR